MMVGGLITGLYPNLIQNAFFSSSVFIGSKCFWQTTQDKLISIHGSGKGSGTRSLGQAKAPEPFARAKQKPWSHEPGSSKGSGTICLGQAKVEGKLKGQKAGTELRTPTCDWQSPHASVLRVRWDPPQQTCLSKHHGQVLSELPSEFLVQPSMWPL